MLAQKIKISFKKLLRESTINKLKNPTQHSSHQPLFYCHKFANPLSCLIFFFHVNFLRHAVITTHPISPTIQHFYLHHLHSVTTKFVGCTTTDAHRDKSSTKNRRCKVIYSYKENKNDELSLAVGDVVEVFEEVTFLVSF